MGSGYHLIVLSFLCGVFAVWVSQYSLYPGTVSILSLRLAYRILRLNKHRTTNLLNT